MIKKILSIVLMIVALAVSVSAADFAITGLKVNGISPSGDSLYVELGDHLTIDVDVTGTTSPRDVRLRAWIGGYEYEVLEDNSEMFSVRDDVKYRKQLQLELPADMLTGDHGYTLNVEMFDANNVVKTTYNLFVSEKRHNIVVQDVNLQPTTLEAGKAAFVKVRLENMGEKKEEDIRVEVSIPELGISERTFVDELSPYNSEENSASAETLYLQIPEDAATGDYEAIVTVIYNRGHEAVQGKKLVHVEGVSKNVAEDSKSLVVVETGSEGMVIGEGKAYSVMLVNLGKEAKTYTVDVAGVASWGTVAISPQVLQLGAGESGEFVVNIDAKEAGTHQFTVTVNEDDKVLKQSTVVVTVIEKSNISWILAGALLVAFLVGIAAIVKLLSKNKNAEDTLPSVGTSSQEPFY